VRNACFSHGDRIYVSYGDCEQEVRMPTAFTPNGDGLNDRLLPVFEHPEQVQSFRMVVYDRWGGVVFVTRDPNEGWDGSGAPAGVYVVHIRHTDLDGTEHDVRTAVTLVR
jgi:gliding motility-associated-like protein